MKPISRRQFAKIATSAALAAPFALGRQVEPMAPALTPGPSPAQEPAKQPVPREQRPAPAQMDSREKTETKRKLSKEQEERVKQAVERRDRQLAAMRGRALPYDAEPAFVFQVRQRPRRQRM